MLDASLFVIACSALNEAETALAEEAKYEEEPEIEDEAEFEDKPGYEEESEFADEAENDGAAETIDRQNATSTDNPLKRQRLPVTVRFLLIPAASRRAAFCQLFCLLSTGGSASAEISNASASRKARTAAIHATISASSCDSTERTFSVMDFMFKPLSNMVTL